MNIRQICLNKHVYLEAENLEFRIFKSEQFVILKINHDAYHHPECLFLPLCILILMSGAAAKSEYQSCSQKVHPLDISQLFVIESDTSQHSFKLLLPWGVLAFEILQSGQSPIDVFLNF